ncbi:Multidrug resistance protein MdtN [Methyloligella halotolerans]|uniref:Multidrug resistance protein MdtN n=1 Tax=Methyloligella halotolerans TaxID=1177755 RepID=A0A1E2S0T6_9HYPH|nr:Multidrug resistance protein MdtN [Methyloligella halotolerans]
MGKVERDADFSPAEPLGEVQEKKPDSTPEPASSEEQDATAVAAKEAEHQADTGPAPRNKRRGRVRLVLFALLPLALAIGAYFYVTGGAVMESENAYVRTDMVAVSTDVSGIVQSVAVHDNQPVKQGDVLFRLDPLPFKLALEKAEGQVGIARAQLEALKGSYAQIETQIDQAKMDVDFYERDFDRKQSLLKRNFASQADYDEAQHNLQDAQQNLASLKTQLAQAAAKLDNHPDYPVEKLSGFKYAVAQRDEAKRQLDHTTVRAHSMASSPTSRRSRSGSILRPPRPHSAWWRRITCGWRRNPKRPSSPMSGPARR